MSLSALPGPSSPEPTTDEVEEEQQLYESLLDKHIERKVNASLRRTLQQESRRGDAPSPSPPTGSSYGPHAGGEAHQPKVTGEIIPWFDPENQSCVVTSWVQKIEQLGAIHRWSDYEKICYMQLRLKGAARDWFNRLTDYDKTWEEWKALLQHAFPRCVDYATTLEELVARKKLPNAPKIHPVGGKLLCTPGGVLDATSPVIFLTNVGEEAIQVKAGRLVGRCESCQEAESSAVLGVSVSEKSLPIVLGDVDYDKSLSHSERDQLFALLNRWSSCFANSTKDLNAVKGEGIEITLCEGTQPVCYRPYKLPLKEREYVREKVKDLLDAGIIRESVSNFASPVILVKKKTGDYRLCVDYRALNKKTVKNIYPMPNIEEQLTKLAGKVYFTSLDCSQGFHQIPVNPNSIEKTAFITPDGHYEYMKMPFGLVNAPSVFQRFVDKALGPLRYEQVLVYMDDLLLPSSSVEEGLQLLNQVFELLDKAGLKLNLKKCSFLKTEIEYLGHHIGSGGITPGMKKTAAVDNFKRPTSVHEVRQFLGLAGYFRKFIRGFASIAFPLTELIKKDNPWCWTDSQEKAFAELKRALVNRPILVPYHNNLETQLHTDASVRGIGGMLLQVQPDQTLKPVAYFSRVTTPAERVYHSYELETIAVVECLKRFRIYLLGRHFKLVTDCTAVRYTFAKRDLIPKIARWWLSVQEYDFEIEHRPGKLMQHVDALSRNAIEHNVNAVHLDESDWFLTLQLQDETLNQIVDRLRENSEPELARCFVFKNNRLYRKALDGPRLVVPKSAR
jgi:hypothetical protein